MFTKENTRGYTDSEIETLNVALRMRMVRHVHSEIDRDQLIKSESDAVNNAFFPGATLNDLI